MCVCIYIIYIHTCTHTYRHLDLEHTENIQYNYLSDYRTKQESCSNVSFSLAVSYRSHMVLRILP